MHVWFADFLCCGEIDSPDDKVVSVDVYLICRRGRAILLPTKMIPSFSVFANPTHSFRYF